MKSRKRKPTIRVAGGTLSLTLVGAPRCLTTRIAQFDTRLRPKDLYDFLSKHGCAAMALNEAVVQDNSKRFEGPNGVYIEVADSTITLRYTLLAKPARAPRRKAKKR